MCVHFSAGKPPPPFFVQGVNNIYYLPPCFCLSLYPNSSDNWRLEHPCACCVMDAFLPGCLNPHQQPHFRCHVGHVATVRFLFLHQKLSHSLASQPVLWLGDPSGIHLGGLKPTWWFIPRIVLVGYNPGYFNGIFVGASRPLKKLGGTKPPTRFVGSSPPSTVNIC